MSGLLIPNNYYGVYCNTITSEDIINGNLIYPSNLIHPVINANPQPVSLNVLSFDGLKIELGFKQEAYYSLYNATLTAWTGSGIITPLGGNYNTLNMLSAYIPAQGVVIGITGYYKISFSGTVIIPATTTITTLQYGLHTVAGFLSYTNLDGLPSNPLVQVVPCSNNAIVKLDAGLDLNLFIAANITNPIDVHNISFSIELLDSVSP